MKLFILALFTTLYGVNGESCSTPSGEEGYCQVLTDCEVLLTLVKNTNRTPQQLDTLRKSHCGYERSMPKVCCPLPCITSEGQPGKCVNIDSCPHTMKQEPFNQTAKCHGPGLFSVCCSPAHIEPIMRGRCGTRNTAYPPDLSSGCCGVTTYQPRIIVGRGPEIDQYPWLALIEYKSPSKNLLLCGGTLISNKYVLTAAHCVTGKILDSGTPISVRLGDHDISNEGADCVTTEGGGEDCADPAVTIPIETIIVHEEFKPRSPLHDIAIIRLRDSAPYTDFIRPLCLPTKDTVIPPSKYIWLELAGWELETSIKMNPVKQNEHLSYVPLDRCQAAYNNRTMLWDRQVCATRERRGSCIGDFGWPLMQDHGHTVELVGVASFGGRCIDDVPEVYTKVFSYLDWIKNKIVP